MNATSARRARTIPCLDLLDSPAARRLPTPPPAPEPSPLLGVLGLTAGDDPVELIGSTVRLIMARLQRPAPPAQKEAAGKLRTAPGTGFKPLKAERNIRLHLTAELTGCGPTELGAREEPPIAPPTACRAIRAGGELIRVAMTPGSKLNPDRPPVRAERRRGAGPEW